MHSLNARRPGRDGSRLRGAKATQETYACSVCAAPMDGRLLQAPNTWQAGQLVLKDVPLDGEPTRLSYWVHAHGWSLWRLPPRFRPDRMSIVCPCRSPWPVGFDLFDEISFTVTDGSADGTQPRPLPHARLCANMMRSLVREMLRSAAARSDDVLRLAPPHRLPFLYQFPSDN